MTTLLILLYGAAAVLIVSGIDTDPTTGGSPSILATIASIWNGTELAGGGATNPTQGTGGTGTQPIPPKGKGSAAPFSQRDVNALYWLQQRGY